MYSRDLILQVEGNEKIIFPLPENPGAGNETILFLIPWLRESGTFPPGTYI